MPQIPSTTFLLIALRNFGRHRLRNVLTVFAVSIAVAMVIGVSITLESVTFQYQRTAATAAGGVDIIVRSSDEFGTMDESVVDSIRKVGGVAAVAGRVTIESKVHTERKTRYAWVTGVSQDDFGYNDASFTNVNGTKELGSWDIVIDSRFKVSIGDNVTVKGFTFRVAGILSTGIFGGISPFGKTTYYCFIDYRTAQQLFEMNKKVSVVFVKAANPAMIGLVSERIRGELPGCVVSEMRRREKTSSYVASFQRILTILSYVPLAICCIICFNTAYASVIERRREIGILQSLGAGHLQILSLFLYESLFIGLIGATVGLVLSGLIAYLFLESLSTILMLGRSGLVGPDFDLTLLGFGVGLASPILGEMIPAFAASSSKIVGNLTPRAGRRPNNVRFIMLASVGSLLVLLGLGVTPQLAIYSVEGVDIFSMALVASGSIIVAAVLLGPLSSVLRIFIFPIARSLSLIPTRNVTRSRTRSVLAFSLIAICLSFTVLIQGLQGVTLTGIEKTVHRLFTADVVVSSDDGIPLKYLDELKRVGDGQMIESLAPAVFMMQTIYSRGQASNVWREIELETWVMAVDPSSFLSMVNVTLIEGGGRTPEDILLGNRNCLLTQSLAEKLDVKVGNRLAINVTDEVLIDEKLVELVALHKIKVAGIISDLGLPYLWIGGRPMDEVLMISYDSLADLFKFSVDPIDTSFTNFLLIKARSSYENNLSKIKQVLLDRYEDRWSLQIFTREDMVAQMKKSIDSLVLVYDMCISFSLLIAGLGIMNVMLMYIAERRKEIFVLRALGSSRLQIALCFICEALTIGWIGYATGIGIGLSSWGFFSPTLVGYGFASAPITRTLLSNAFLVATLTAVIGTVYPAYSATQFPSIEHKKRFAKAPSEEVGEAKISETLKDILQYLKSSQRPSQTMNFRVPDSLVRSVALTFLRSMPAQSNLIEASTWEAESTVQRLVNCILILRFDPNLPLRHVSKVLTKSSDASKRIVLIPESTFQNLARESQELIPWFLEPQVDGRPAPTPLLETSGSNRERLDFPAD